MRITYDISADAIYIRVKGSEISYQERISDDIKRISDDIICDFDRDRELVGIEVLDVRAQPVDRLKDIRIKLTQSDRAILKDVLSKLAAAM